MVPVIVVFAVLLTLGVAYTKDHLAQEAQRWLLAHSREQAASLALELGRVPLLAEGLGDLMLADPEQPQSLIYAHLIDGLRRTPLAERATVTFFEPARGAALQRGEAQGEVADGEEVRQPAVRGWQRDADRLAFVRPITGQGRQLGNVRIEVIVANIYASLQVEPDTQTRLFVRDAEGLIPPPGPEDAVPASLAATAADHGAVHQAVVEPGSEVAYWVVTAPLPGLPLAVTATRPTASALAPVHAQVTRVALVLLAALAGLLLAIGIVARRLTQPLQTLDAAVRQVADGRFDVAPDIHSRDELGRLGAAISQMARQIKQRETELRRTQLALEQRVAERTEELQKSNAELEEQFAALRRTEQALRAASEQAERASRAKSEFLSNMSHELRTPLHGVLGYAQILRRESSGDPQQQESLLAIERCGQHLLTLINQILDLTRIEAGQLAAHLQTVNLPRLLEDVELIMAQRAEAKGLSLSVVSQTTVPELIRTDPVKLKQILLNLVSNAIKFTSEGEVKLAVETGSDSGLRFSVRDTGSGIPSEQIERIFDPFHQLGTPHATDGTGLGLTINNKLIQLLGGEPLSVDSTPGQGSLFRFSLPAGDATEPAAEVLPTEIEATARATPEAKSAGAQSAKWPQTLAMQTAQRVQAAAEMGDVTGLLQLVEQLSADPMAPRPAIARIAELTQSFDFDGLRQLALELCAGDNSHPDPA